MFNLQIKKYWFQYSVAVLSLGILLLVNALPFRIFSEMPYTTKLVIFVILVTVLFNIASRFIFYLTLVLLVGAGISIIARNAALADLFMIATYDVLTIAIIKYLMEMPQKNRLLLS